MNTSIFDIQESFLNIPYPLIFRPNIPYPYNFLPKYPVSR